MENILIPKEYGDFQKEGVKITFLVEKNWVLKIFVQLGKTVLVLKMSLFHIVLSKKTAFDLMAFENYMGMGELN